MSAAEVFDDTVLLASIANVDRYGDIVSSGNTTPRNAALRSAMIARHYIAWDGVEGRYCVTSVGRDFQMRPRFDTEPARGQVVSFRRPVPPRR